MGTREGLEPEYDLLENDFDADLDLDFEEDLESYLTKHHAAPGRGARRSKRYNESDSYRLPKDWQDFDFEEEGWDNA